LRRGKGFAKQGDKKERGKTMNENNEIMNEELALIEVDSIGETLSAIIEQDIEIVNISETNQKQNAKIGIV
jgi:hypothetical protein